MVTSGTLTILEGSMGELTEDVEGTTAFGQYGKASQRKISLWISVEY